MKGLAFRRHLILLGAVLAGLLAVPPGSRAGVVDLPGWLEPRGLSLVDLVGQVPDEALRGMILSASSGAGLVVYESGQRQSDTLTIRTTIYPRFSAPSWAPNARLTSFGCLGQMPFYDHLGSVAPPSTLRVYDSSGTDVTSAIQYMDITHMGTGQPCAGASEYYRYLPQVSFGPYKTYPLPLGAEGLQIPANSGCRIEMPGVDLYPLTGVFTLRGVAIPRVSLLHSQRATFQSYLGPGDVGIFQPLMQQLRERYGDRHERIPLDLPGGADYFLLKFPLMPGDAYTDRLTGPPYPNAGRPSGGTYRLAGSPAWQALSADLTFSAAFPLHAVWQDADQAGDSLFLPAITQPTALAPPEYVLPAGIGYHRCFTQGDCPAQVLEQIYAAVMNLEIFYLVVSRPMTGVESTSLKMAGPAWRPVELVLGGPTRGEYRAVLPIVFKWLDTGVAEGCPRGWFDVWGRMLDYVPCP
jgi:hypothetical protein